MDEVSREVEACHAPASSYEDAAEDGLEVEAFSVLCRGEDCVLCSVFVVQHYFSRLQQEYLKKSWYVTKFKLITTRVKISKAGFQLLPGVRD